MSPSEISVPKVCQRTPPLGWARFGTFGCFGRVAGVTWASLPMAGPDGRSLCVQFFWQMLRSSWKFQLKFEDLEMFWDISPFLGELGKDEHRFGPCIY